MPSGDHCPLPAVGFNLTSTIPGSWPSQSTDKCIFLSPLGNLWCQLWFLPGNVHSWFRACVSPRLDLALHGNVRPSMSNVDLRALTVNQNPKCCLWTFVSRSLPWKLCNSSPCFPRFLACSLAPQGDLSTACSCLAFSDFREQWCRRVSVLWKLLLNGLAILGCSTQALLTTLLPLSRTSLSSGMCVNGFFHCCTVSPSADLPMTCLGSLAFEKEAPQQLLWVFFARSSSWSL